jgi:hypothetical protein
MEERAMGRDDEQREPMADPDAAPVSEPADDDDTEGHSLLLTELGRTVANARSQEAEQWARGEKARREAKKDDRKKR